MDIKFEKLPIPIKDRVFVLRDSPISKSDTGLILVKKIKQTVGTVLIAGEDKKYDPNGLVKEGARVMFGDWAGVSFKHEGKWILSMRIKDVFGILK